MFWVSRTYFLIIKNEIIEICCCSRNKNKKQITKKITKIKNKQTKIVNYNKTNYTTYYTSRSLYVYDPKGSYYPGLQKISSSWLNLSIYLIW